MFSIRATIAAMTASGLGENAIISALRSLKEAGKLRADGYVMQSDVDAAIREYSL
jgi:hypothetical protein